MFGIRIGTATQKRHYDAMAMVQHFHAQTAMYSTDPLAPTPREFMDMVYEVDSFLEGEGPPLPPLADPDQPPFRNERPG